MNVGLGHSESLPLETLYQEVIMEHSRRPRYKNPAMACRFCQEGKNPLCGDTVTVYCQVHTCSSFPSEEKSVAGSASFRSTPVRISLGFSGSGCSISQASASIMCSSLQNVTLTEARQLLQRAAKIYTGQVAIENHEDLEDDLEALHGVSKFPVRIKCAALPWKTLEILLNENFDKNGEPRSSCEKENLCPKRELNKPKLKIVSTEMMKSE